MWINRPQFLYYRESKWRKFTSYNNALEKHTDIQSNEKDLSYLTNVHVKSVRNLKKILICKGIIISIN